MVSGFMVIGDATMDVSVTPSRPLRSGGDVPATIRFTPGGQGANVAVRLARRGADVALVSAIGTDAAGRFLAEALDAEGVRMPPLSAGRSSAVIALLDPAGERSMLSDRQAVPLAGAAPLLADASWVHVSAYALLDGREGDEVAALLAHRQAGTLLSVAGGSVAPDPDIVHGLRARLSRVRPQMVVVNGDEADALIGSAFSVLREKAQRLASLASIVIVTAANEGSVASHAGQVLEVPAARGDGPVVDATGSGDAYLAALIEELEPAGWPPTDELLRHAMELASLAGSRTARVPGAQGWIAGEARAAGASA